ncbi:MULTISPECIES: S41 family peptidase [Vagococcus]|uniref:S41 family peptidase n=1 Tax=Vagococcus TaxID=2737 RepID=UPI002FC66393
MKKIISIVIVNIIVIFIALSFFSLPSEVESRGFEAFGLIEKNGIINNQQEWDKVIELTQNGKNITNVEDLNVLLRASNKHNSVMLSNNLIGMEKINFPTSSELGEFTIINIPSTYSNNINDLKIYTKVLATLIHSASRKIILNLSNNLGGVREPMIIGSAALIPDGILFNEIDNKQNRYPLTLKEGKLSGGIPGTLMREQSLLTFPPPSKKKLTKVAIVTNECTASAAEALVLALKNNPNTKVFGMSSAGLTSINTSYELIAKDDKESWFLNYTIGYYEMVSSEKTHAVFNSNPIIPDKVVSFSIQNPESQDIINSSNNQSLFQAIELWFNQKEE